MATSYTYKPIVIDGLVTYIDSFNHKSYLPGSTYSQDIVGQFVGDLNNGTSYDASTKSFVFDGVDDMISFYDINVNGYDKITINFWVNLSNDTGGLVQYWKDSDANGGGIEVEIYSGTIYIAFRSNEYFYTLDPITIGVWSNYTVVYNGQSVGMKLGFSLMVWNITYHQP